MFFYVILEGISRILDPIFTLLLAVSSLHIIYFCRPLVRLIEARNMTVQVKASSAIEALCTDNPANQDEFLAQDTPKYLIRLLKVCL